MVNRPSAPQPQNPGQAVQQQRNWGERLKNWLTSLFRRSPTQTTTSTGSTTYVERKFPRDHCRIVTSAYFSSLVIVGTIIPIVTSLAAVVETRLSPRPQGPKARLGIHSGQSVKTLGNRCKIFQASFGEYEHVGWA